MNVQQPPLLPTNTAPTNLPPNIASVPPNSRPLQPAQFNTLRPNTSGAYGTSTSPLMSYSQSPSQNANYPTTPNTGGPLPSVPPNAIQQNQLNNNQPPPQMGQQRKPMYPTNQQLPPMMQQQPPQQQQQPPPPTQQPYSAAYNYPQQQQQPQQQTVGGAPQPQPGMFNGQRTAGPLQYQNQAYPQQQQQQPQVGSQYPPQGGSVLQHGFNRLWGQDTIDLMQNRHILSPATLPPPKIVLHNQFHESINCNPK